MATPPTNPGTVTQSDIDTLEQGMKDLTSLGQQLKNQFRAISKETDVSSTNFKDMVKAAGLNNNNAERYLISQRLQEATQNRINEIKSKSSFLDSVGLAFKKEEIVLQIRLASAQIRALQTNAQIARLNAAERLKAIESLQIQNVLRGAELRYATTSVNNQSRVLTTLNAQLATIEGFTPNLQRNNTILGTFKEIGKDPKSLTIDQITQILTEQKLKN